MRHCTHCLHKGYVLNTYGEEIACSHCQSGARRPVDKSRARRALQAARRAVIEKFQRDDLGKRKKAVL